MPAQSMSSPRLLERGGGGAETPKECGKIEKLKSTVFDLKCDMEQDGLLFYFETLPRPLGAPWNSLQSLHD